MKLIHMAAACTIAAASICDIVHAAEFTEYLGKIPVASGAAPLAAGPSGQLFYGTLRAGTSEIRVIENPTAEIGSVGTATGAVIATYPFVNTRGFQGLFVTSMGVGNHCMGTGSLSSSRQCTLLSCLFSNVS